MNCPAFNRKFPNEESLIQYIEQNRELDIVKGHCSLLIFACKKKYETAAFKLLEHRPDEIKLSQIHNGSTALMIACKNGLTDIVNSILDFGSDDILINKTDHNNDNAFAIICSPKTPIPIDVRTKLCYKILDNHLDGLYLYSKNRQGNTPLMVACESELEDLVLNVLYDVNPMMLNLGATNNKGEDILQIAYFYGLWDHVFPKLNETIDLHKGNVGNLPKLPTYDKPTIDLNTKVYDVIELQEHIVQDYIRKDPGNIVIKVGDKLHLSNREYIKRQAGSAFVFECKEANIKRKDNITANLPLYNLKMIGVDVTPDQVGIIPEYIFVNTSPENKQNGMEYVINSNDQLFSIIPVYDRMLVSVISANEYVGIGSGFSGVGSVHCQAGQGGLSGIIVKAYPGETVVRETRRNTRRSTHRPRNRMTRSSSIA